jgi:hypothetical protein
MAGTRPVHASATGQSTFDCPCCGRLSRTIWGEIHHDNGGAVAIYYCRWTIGDPDHDAGIDLVIGDWGDGTTPQNRFLISMLFRRSEEASFMVVDAGPKGENFKSLASLALSREQVVGYPVASHAFTIVDAIWDDDPRIAALIAAR